MAESASVSPPRVPDGRSRRSRSPRSRHGELSPSRKPNRSRSPLRNLSHSPEPDQAALSQEASGVKTLLDNTSESGQLQGGQPQAPPLPDEDVPPLPDEPPPKDGPTEQDDGWQPVWDANAQAYYFYNRLTQLSQWENPRVPDVGAQSAQPAPARTGAAGGYNPAIHGDYDPNADYATGDNDNEAQLDSAVDPIAAHDYSASASFNRFTGSFTNTSLHPNRTPDAHTAEAKAYRQMQAHFDVEGHAAQYDGRSLKEERQQRKLSKKELQAYKAKNKARKEEKARAWLKG